MDARRAKFCHHGLIGELHLELRQLYVHPYVRTYVAVRNCIGPLRTRWKVKILAKIMTKIMVKILVKIFAKIWPRSWPRFILFCVLLIILTEIIHCDRGLNAVLLLLTDEHC